MGIFDNLFQIDENNNIINNQWVEWHHALIPNQNNILRQILRFSVLVLGHCINCTALSGVYFARNNIPEYPQHPHCDCLILNIAFSKVLYNASATFPANKIKSYVFNSTENGKKEIFESIGYSLETSDDLRYEMQQQALENYLKGNYRIKGLDRYGQRIAIPITLNGTTFYSGWILEPEGRIRNTTPFGGWIK